MKNTVIAAALALSMLPTLASAGTVKFPEEAPSISINIPESWEPAETDGYLECTSPDDVATLYFQVVASKKESDKVIGEFIDWLVEEHQVKIDAATQKTADVDVAGRTWGSISWDGASKEYGPAKVGFWSTVLGDGKVLIASFWISKKDSEKSLATIEGKIFPSVKPIKE